jgi:transposase
MSLRAFFGGFPSITIILSPIVKSSADRVHSCSCGLILDRDENAAINILALGAQSMGFALEAPSYL